MKKLVSIMCALAAATALFGAISSEIKELESGDKTKTVEVYGRGFTEASALKDAARNAVTYVVGQYIDAQTITQNESDINDKIIAVSSGFVEDLKIVAGPEKEGGSTILRAQAKVKMEQIRQRITSFAAAETAVDAKAEKAKRSTKATNRRALADLVIKTAYDAIKTIKIDILAHDVDLDDDSVLLVKLQASLPPLVWQEDFWNPTVKAFKDLGMEVTGEHNKEKCPCIAFVENADIEKYHNSEIYKYIPLPLLKKTDFGDPFCKYVVDRFFSYPNVFRIRIACFDKNGKELISEFFDNPEFLTGHLVGADHYGAIWITVAKDLKEPRTKIYKLKFAAPEQIEQIAKITAELVKKEQK